ncbi:uncharacterized protein LOC128557134 [Mercenaria mercenaria]|uniref:uncharacterized protein LOC128557134 n=1 Tax=Mercenaria mercenaria TaxID=6596 RepID=UPI00234F3D8C|nr:uncharacterized protein LOC128557134 [Mercenaria mercenaria]
MEKYMSDITHASDEVPEMFCEQCEQHSVYAAAEGFCVDCSEYMCKTCLVYHKRYMPGHTQQDTSTMSHDYCVEKCSIHPKLLLKFYCQTCEKFACTDCKINDHKNCEHVGHISTFVSHVENKEALEDIKEYIDYLKGDLEEMQKKISQNTEHISLQEINAKKTMYVHREKMKKNLQDMKQEMVDIYDTEINDAEEILRELRQKREETIECFNAKENILEKNLKEAEMDMEQKIEDTKVADLTKLSNIEQKNTDIANDLEKMILNLEQKQKSGERCSTFIAVKTSQKVLESFEDDMKELKDNSNTSDFKVEAEANSFTFETVDSTKKFFSYKKIEKSRKQQSAVHHSQLQIKPVHYTSLCLLNESKLLITDYKNSMIYAFEDLLENKLLSALQMPSAPWGITKVNDNEVAITFPELGIVRFLEFSEMMTVMKTKDVKVGYECYGIACGRNRLIISYLDPSRVKILDMSGNVLKCFDKNSEDSPSFSSPRHLALSPNKRLIYVSDRDNNSVTSMTFDGKVKAIYKDNQLTAPFQLAVDREGLVYVCGRGSNNVHQLSSDLTKINILLNDKHELVKPVSVALCEDENRLYIGSFSCNNIQVFELMQK